MLNKVLKKTVQSSLFKPTRNFTTIVHGETASLSIGVPKEVYPDEKRVSMTPDNVTKLTKQGFTLKIEKDAGKAANILDADYEKAGASIVGAQEAFESDVVLKVRPPQHNDTLGKDEVDALKENATLITYLQPGIRTDIYDKLLAANVTSFAMDQIPRISRAQVFDALSSMANISGYKAVIEAAGHFGRFFTGQITAAGRLPPAKVLIIGGGVAGLSAAVTAKNLGAVVRLFDTRSAVREQAESVGAQFLDVSFEESGDGAGGYAKEMSKEYLNAQMEMFLKQAKEVDIVISTALIPGKKAPNLWPATHVAAMKPGSVVIDLASEAGGNCELTTPNEIVISDNNVKVVGYTDFPSRLAGQSSALYSNNIVKFLQSMITKENVLQYDLDDDVCGRSIVTNQGQKLWPNPKPLPMLDAKKKEVKVEKVEEVVDPFTGFMKNAVGTAIGLSSFVGLGVLCPDPAFLGMVTTFSLAVIAGYQSVWGVAHSLHTPLMSVTNAISGLTAAGGLFVIGGGLFPHSIPQLLGSIAVLISSVNIFGGFLITKRMLDMFKRPSDPPEYSYLYGLSGAAMVGSLFTAHYSGVPHIHIMGYLTSGVLCIGAIVGLASQTTARSGLALGATGVGSALVVTLLACNFSPAVLTQALVLIGAGAAAGITLGSRVAVTELPQCVAGFHALVGLAAVTTSIGSYCADAHPDMLHAIASYFGVFIGGVTFTGSLAAFRKLANLYKDLNLNVPFAGLINTPIMILNIACLSLMLKNPAVGALMLSQSAITSSIMGWNITNNIGAADMPVAITVLNSYSGWALCAEGFMLNNPLLTIVGSLIGSSGAILTYIMCVAMNRSLQNVIFGSYADLGGGAKQAEITGTHTETTVDAVVEMIVNSKDILVVPGYGLAVAQAQYVVGEIAKICQKNQIRFRFAIHPVAGRMPGQLNVLLAEVGIPYDIVHEMDEVQGDIPDCDIGFVLGANDIVNSSAEEDENSPIWGMPVIQIWKAKTCIINKRTMGTGYADIQNPLFFKENSLMLLGNAKPVCEQIKAGLDAHYA